ncbi:MAG: hypothetical protein R3213_11125 [Flavobacteriaceae bacterium]|nr:hypothetical protein [Flavobacteriaceae bacterium]
MQSLHQAVKDVKKSTTISAVKILYAGTGPFATLVLPLISRFSPKELHFVFLEANLVSIEILKKVVSALKINDYVADFYHCDAANFILPDHIKDCDIVLIECLQHALAREPQVAISYNLLPQMSGNPILIPEEIELSAAILDYRFKFNDENQLAPNSKIEYQSPPLFRINKEEIKKNKRSASENLIFTPSEWRFDRAVISEENNTLSILTKIKVYKEHELPKNASGLTLPLYLADLIREKDITGVKAQYEIGLEPGLKVSYL